MTVKTDYSRFDIHDELTAPEGSDPDPEGHLDRAAARSRSSSACSPAPPPRCAPTPGCAHELRAGVLPRADPRADRAGGRRAPRRRLQRRPARPHRAARAGLGLDEISRARSFTSADPSARRRCSPSSRRCSTPTARPTAHLQRGGARGRLDRRGDPRGGRPAGARRVPEPDRERGRACRTTRPTRRVLPDSRRLQRASGSRRRGPGRRPRSRAARASACGQVPVALVARA